MEALKTTYRDIPPLIPVPKEFVHRSGEVIFIIDKAKKEKKKKYLKEFYGTIPDFPDRVSCGDYDKRKSL